jgi:hypothetical protein
MDSGLSGLALCLFGRDIPERGVKALTIVVSFDVGEQVVPSSISGRVAHLMHKFGFQGSASLSVTDSPTRATSARVEVLDQPGHTWLV